MGTLRYSVICSVDGYAADAEGGIDWSAPGQEVHSWINGRERDVTTHVLGRRMYEALRVWDHWPPGRAVEDQYAALWAGIDKIVCSDTLEDPGAPRTTVEPQLTSRRLAEIVARTDGVVSVGGPTTAGPALRAGMVDEIELIVVPWLIGGGLRALPTGVLGQLRGGGVTPFDDGTVAVRYLPR